MNHFKSHLLAAAALLATTPATLLAQTPTEEAPLPPDAAAPVTPAQPGAQIADAKVDQFAAAFVAVEEIQAQASQQLNSTTDSAKATEVKANAEKQMIQAVERSGLEVEEFNRIADLMTSDLALRSRVIEKVQQRRKG